MQMSGEHIWSRCLRSSVMDRVDEVVEKIRNSGSYLHVSAMEQILATSLISPRLKITDLISLSSGGADRKWRVLSPCIGYGVDFSHQPYLSEVAREQVEDTSLIFLSYGANFSHQPYLSEVAREQVEDTSLTFLRSYLHVSAIGADFSYQPFLPEVAVEQVEVTNITFLKLL
ncbi:hypothetical protein PVK06_020065 [Gossypium arboreum]|uniref:Uncharacterized protein n=1 Tax=Gossypium arboreum TaxID=29729 RepID=A0ABR0PLH0_GOSAR|nr:hypothetical protein PVK06_020065 [Gossypium arboreum]